MSSFTRPKINLTQRQARKVWLTAQGLHRRFPFRSGFAGTLDIIKHLGYVQIDTINVIERAHHHILWSRQPDYRRGYLTHLQSVDKSVFEHWTHALSYIPVAEFSHYVDWMKAFGKGPSVWYKGVTPSEVQRILRLIKKQGPISIRDIDDEKLVDKDHEWASRKPSKKVLQFLFYSGRLVISQRMGMLKQYELTERHFGWSSRPKPSTKAERREYILRRSACSQGLFSVESVTHLERAKAKQEMKKYILQLEKKGVLIPVQVEDFSKIPMWIRADDWQEFQQRSDFEDDLVHLLSPFDPLVIQRKRFDLLFNHDHRFEAYVPKEKRKFGYFALPVLYGSDVVALIDLKTDRAAKKLLIQQWTWLKGFKSKELKRTIEEELDRFSRFQLAAE